ncbi:MAG: aminopeptidase P N-terminal domain-containing protein [Lewinellaceae bacterium]|nr:aminopeptidase P N-terminal domain-containing protein [Lewinellaceae bacterium]HRW76095.1 aminopeptidase P N-terminal domain-containing protein [Saprospiraceae bacterium]
MRYDPIDPQLFVQNRRRFAREMKPDSIAIFHSNDQMPRNGDQFFEYRQNSNLFYLSGLDQPEVIVVLFPDCIKDAFREVAFIKRSNEKISIWEGYKYTKEDARKVSGIDKVYFLDEMETVLHELILLAKRVYLNVPENDRFQPEVESRDARLGRQLMAKYPGHKYHRAQPILKKLVMIKSDIEIGIMRHCMDITDKAFRRVLQFVKPGVMEYEVEAEIGHEFIRNRAWHGYHPIIGSGKNNCVLHYNENNQRCQDGELLLLDFGAEYANYSADLTRTIPVNGVYSERQKAVYNAVLRVMKEATTMLVPGNNLTDYQKEVGRIMESELLGLGLISKDDIKKQDPDWPAYKKYFMHGTSHHLGLDVHDSNHRYDPIQAGMVFTCEPGIYIPEEGFGIRIENDILVTDHEPVDLMAHIPVEAEEIEALMQATVLQ